MQVVIGRKANGKQRIYHKQGCFYTHRIKPDNWIEMSINKANKKHYKQCQCCAGLRGEVLINKAQFDLWSNKYKVKFRYSSKQKALFISTNVGFWKVVERKKDGYYLLYHRNSYSNDMNFEKAVSGDYHRQSDVKATNSIHKIINYISGHDKAKVKIMDDYRKLPKQTKRQKKYYNNAKQRQERNESRRIARLFECIEKSDADLIKCSIC